MAKKLLNEEFSLNGIRFSINENFNHNEYEGKYKLMWYLPEFDSWGRVATSDSMRWLRQRAEIEAKVFC